VTTCNRCGGVLPATATICHHCGTPVMPGAPGSNLAGSLGARQRAQEKWGSSLLPTSGPLSGFPPPPPGQMNQNLPPGAGQGPGSPVPPWRATSLIDPAQLPDWLNPAASGAFPRPGEGNRNAAPGAATSGPRSAWPGAGAQPPVGPGMPPAGQRPPAPPRQSGTSGSPYFASGRRATDDLFMSSSLIDQNQLQNQLPDWLAPRVPRQPKPAAPPAGTSGPGRHSGPLGGTPPPPRPTPAIAQDSGRDAHLPDWLRAMDPGAPPDLSRLHNSGPGRAGGRSPASPYQSPTSDNRAPRTSGNPGTDPFSISRLDAALPPLEGFSPGAGPSSVPGRPSPSNPDPFAARSPFGQSPTNQPPRLGDSFPGANRNPGFPAMGTSQPGGAGMPGGWQPDRRPSHPSGEAASGFSANSLVDKTMVPEWMREIDPNIGAQVQPPKAGPLSGPRPAESSSGEGAAKAAQPSAASPFDGASLVDEGALPDWLRSSRETEPLPLPFTVSESVSTMRVSKPNEKKAGSSGEDAGADEDALPEWLQQVYSEANVPPLYEDKPPVTLGPQTFSGADLVDKRSVPTWIREAEMTSPLANINDILTTTPPVQPQGPSAANAQATAFAEAGNPLAEPFAARSLVNEEELPEWMRHLGGEGTAAPPKDSSGLYAEAGAAGQASTSGFFAASELIDTHALPVWMKGQEPPAAAPEAAAKSAEQPGIAGGSASGIFSAAELVDTHMLPVWMKGQEPQSAPQSFADAEAAGPSGSASGIFSASELIDTHTLPAWMKGQEPQAAPAAGAPANQAGQSGALGSTSGIFSAAELVDTQALPAWLKANEAPTSQPSQAPVTSGPLEGRPPSSKITPMPAGFASQTTGAFSAAELVDTHALPAWLKDNGSSSAGAPGSPGSQSASARPPEDGMSATELVDTGVLPAWLRGAGDASTSGPGAAKPASGAGFQAARGPASSAGSDQTGGFSAASLVDPEALPEWLRPAQSGALNSGAVASRSGSGADWGSGNLPEPSGFSAGTLIDPKELPDWMQSQGGVQRPGAQPLEGNSGEDGPQARVPRRPRLSNEPDRAPSQAAASVFSSVLGPTAGEEPRDQSLLSASGIREMPVSDRSNPFNQLNAQAQGQSREGGTLGGWNQPPAAGPGGDWSSSYVRTMAEEPPDRQRQGYRPLGPLSEAQRSRPPFQQPEEFEENGPATRRPAGRPGPDAGFGMPAGPEQDPFGGRGFGEYPAAQQGRGAPPRLGYQSGFDGWEGGPGFEQGYLDDEVGPPSGMFAKLKRMLGFGR
jgi:hypothetical protein